MPDPRPKLTRFDAPVNPVRLATRGFRLRLQVVLPKCGAADVGYDLQGSREPF